MYIDVEELKVIRLPPYELVHVELEHVYYNDLPTVVAVVDAIFSCYRLGSLSLRLDGSISNFKCQVVKVD